MIVYLDSSVIVKQYIEEADSTQVRRVITDATTVTTSLLAYVECRSAFARKRRSRELTDEQYRTTVEGFDDDWQTYGATELGTGLIHAAGLLAEKYPLKGSDAVHLASALAVRRSTSEPVYFWAADSQLSRAAQQEGLLQPS